MIEGSNITKTTNNHLFPHPFQFILQLLHRHPSLTTKEEEKARRKGEEQKAKNSWLFEITNGRFCNPFEKLKTTKKKDSKSRERRREVRVCWGGEQGGMEKNEQ